LLDHYEARWVVCGFTQRTGVDFGETFTSVIKLVTIRTVLTIAASRQWPTRKLDVSNAFLHGTHQEHVLYQQPTCFVDPACPNAVCLLDKSLYGLWQAPWAWYDRFVSFAIKLGFQPTRSNSSLFVLQRGPDTTYLLLYVDDMVLTGSSKFLLQRILIASVLSLPSRTSVNFVSFSTLMSSVLLLVSTCLNNGTPKTFLIVLAWCTIN
jgi:hypothetical protein